MREEFTEHKGVVGLGVVLREADVLVHVERDNILEPAPARRTVRVAFALADVTEALTRASLP